MDRQVDLLAAGRPADLVTTLAFLLLVAGHDYLAGHTHPKLSWMLSFERMPS